MMQFKSHTQAPARLKSDCMVVPLFSDDARSNQHLKALPKNIENRVKSMVSRGVLNGKAGETVYLQDDSIKNTDMLLICGAGSVKQIDRESLRVFGGNMITALKNRKFKTVSLLIPDKFKMDKDHSAMSQSIVEGIVLGSYEYTRYKDAKQRSKWPERIVLIAPQKTNKPSFEDGIKTGRIAGWGQNLSRELIGHPSNYLTPQEMARVCRNLAKQYKFQCKVLSEAQIARLKMNCLLAVNAGSDKPVHFIIMSYKGPRAPQKPVCLVGKGITFDSGGISIKPAANMDEMKGDMGGAACVIASIASAAQLKLPVNLVALVPTTENLPSGSAYKPGDVLTALNGVTVEVLNTDAEGRLILADALAYSHRLKPAAIIDVATLTGAAKIALGFAAAAFFVNNDKLRKQFNQAADNSGERIWEMPLWKDYQEQIKSSIADIKNTGGRPAGTCTAAAFLNNFTGDFPWAHIDMAALDVEYKGGAYKPKGSSGYGVRLILEFLRNWK